ncbi:MAG: hypothetical protein RL757_2185 [Bacteroidota bacterium]
MKINKIYIKNINSIREATIDFLQTPLSDATFYAIVGQTGAGKSTILDAITLALYGRVPRLKNAAFSRDWLEKTGAVLRRDTTESIIEISYATRTGAYRARWECLRGKDLNAFVIDATTNEILTQKKTESYKKNEELIGLNYEQFVKAVLLAQGAFAQFLQASKKERSEILKDITGFEIYEKIGIATFRKFKDAADEIKNKKTEFQAKKSDLLNKTALKSLEKELNTLEKTLEATRMLRQQLEKKVEIKQKIAQIETDLQRQQAEKTTQRTNFEAFLAHEMPRLESFERAVPLESACQQLENEQQKVEEIEKKINVSKEKLRQNEANIQLFLEQMTALLPNEAMNLDNFLSVFSEAIQKINQLNSQIELAENEAQNKAEIFRHALKNAKIDENTLKNGFDTGGGAFLENQRQNIENQYAKLAAMLDLPAHFSEIDLSEKRNDFQIQIADLKILAAKQQEGIQLKNNLSERKMRQNELQTILQSAHQNMDALTSEIKELEPEIEALEQQKIGVLHEISLQQFQDSLQAGKPCPVCGSAHHEPLHQLKIKAKGFDIQTIIDSKKKTLKEKEIQKTNENATQARAQGEQKALETTIEKIENQLEILRQNYAEICEKSGIRLGENLEKVIENFAQKVRFTNELETLLRQRMGFAAVMEAANWVESATTHAQSLRQKMAQQFPMAAQILKQQQTQLQRFHELQNLSKNERQGLTENENSLVQWTKKVTGLATDLSQKLEKLDFPNVQSLQQALTLGHESAQQLRSKRANFEEIQTRLAQSILEKSQQLAEILTDETQNLPDLAVLEAEKKETDLKINSFDKERTERQNQLHVQHRLDKEVQILKEKIDVLSLENERWNLLSGLIGDAKGANFMSFAQEVTLARLIEFANLRLQKLNPRYQLDQPKANEADELMIVDAQMGDERRIVNTLSGGETFLVSLALALALSDLTSGKVKIESLFIDEGFGMLDNETLEEVIATLETLQGSDGRQIGIISHVDALKERIPTQIQVTKMAGGFSEISII